MYVVGSLQLCVLPEFAICGQRLSWAACLSLGVCGGTFIRLVWIAFLTRPPLFFPGVFVEFVFECTNRTAVYAKNMRSVKRYVGRDRQTLVSAPLLRCTCVPCGAAAEQRVYDMVDVLKMGGI